MFPYNDVLKNELRIRFPSAKWSQSNKAWYLPDFQSIRTIFGLQQKDIGQALLPHITPINQQVFINMRAQLQLKWHSHNTIRIYLNEFAHLLMFIKIFPVEKPYTSKT